MNDGIFTSFDLGIRCYSGNSGPGAGYNIAAPTEVDCDGTYFTCLTQTSVNTDGESLYHACGKAPTARCVGREGGPTACYCDGDLCNAPWGK